ncbi:15-hydroxyprostaglandin dehydrogenase [NAD(+)]-like [Phlebotomus argentipes]|uniref:15-hydroxyprostaglandin dehydrogenase [NAD(+)]-like n=1 Tax=Phlebotomus argentipes TaxID=94469 RepID=UPI002892F197|nr:15-hydroxyprostaglandin dehydrogenase [NAD(+)]-like [Phlebotomus argentipes]
MDLKGKSALVTGGSGAIGKAICEELLKNGIKNLGLIDLQPGESTVNDWKSRFPSVFITFYRADVTLQEDLELCFKKFTEEIQNLDIVVNCAGILNESEFKKVIEVNLIAVIRSTLLAIDCMRVDSKCGKGGVVLNIVSDAGFKIFRATPSYGASKHGLLAYTRSVALEGKDLGMRFISLCPAQTKSELYDGIFSPGRHFMPSKWNIEEEKASNVAQEPAEVGKAAAEVIRSGENGSVWVVKQGKLSEVTIPAVEF